jgi:carbonic anhydrase
MKSLFFPRIILLAVAFSLFALPSVARPSHWAYTGPEDPSTWGKLNQSYAACALGHRQSPINSTSGKKTDLSPLKLDYKLFRSTTSSTMVTRYRLIMLPAAR